MMPKKPQPGSRPAPSAKDGAWSVASGSLTSKGRSDLLRQLGSQMRDDYQHVVNEPVPDHLEQLVGKLKKRRKSTAKIT